MRWFKHFSDNYRGRSVDQFYDELGHTGIACYYLLLEICTEKLDNNATNVEPKFSFPSRFVQRNLRVSSAKLEVFLRVGQGLGLFSYKISQKEIAIEMPILLDLLHYDLLKSGSRRESVKSESRLDKERDKERDKDKERERDSADDFFDFWNSLNLPKINAYSKSRKNKFKQRVSEYGIEKMQAAAKIILSVDFLSGKNDRNWKADIDWFLGNDTNISKILENKYSNNKKTDPVSHAIDQYARFSKGGAIWLLGN